jgi:hypothetical protein
MKRLFSWLRRWLGLDQPQPIPQFYECETCGYFNEVGSICTHCVTWTPWPWRGDIRDDH